MPSRFENIRNRLPSLYRPDADDTSLLTNYIAAVSDRLEALNKDAIDVLQSHWFSFADRAMFNAYFILCRELQGLAFPEYNEPELTEFNKISDLAKLASLLRLPPWQEPPNLREPVEAYRLRISRIVKTYQNGLGTVNALRSMVEAQLPLMDEGLQDRSFSIEEFVPVVKRSAKKVQGIFEDKVAPLMRWTLDHDGLEAASPTLYIQGVEPEAGAVDATKAPVIELYQAETGYPRIGIGYRGTVENGQTLRLRPAFASFIAKDAGMLRSESLPSENSSANPAAPGPWQAVEGSPEDRIVDICKTLDNQIFVATVTGMLFRFDGQTWIQALDELPEPLCLAEYNHNLIIGTKEGMFYMPLFPEQGEPFQAIAVETLGELAINVIFRSKDGQWWIGAETGLFKVFVNTDTPGATTYDIDSFALSEANETATQVHAIHEDASGNLFFGTELGLMQYQAGTNHWYWYEGKEKSDRVPDWQRFDPSAPDPDERNFPTEDMVYLPAVKSICRGPDESLWLGTTHGIARYTAQVVRGLTYDTVLEAFPDLADGPVYKIEKDARERVWFCTDKGLFSFDGRDWWQAKEGGCTPIGRADTLYNTPKEPRGAWHFVRGMSKWQRIDQDDQTITQISSDEGAVYSILFADHVVADIGEWDGECFTHLTPVETTDLVMRYKPEETRIVTGGMPSIPRQPVSTSVWRYLSLEPDDLTEPSDLPAWTIEGRLWQQPDLPIPYPGRYNDREPPVHPESYFDEVVFAFHPAARVWFERQQRQLMSVLLRINKRSQNETIDPAILDRVWQGIEQVRPAGIQAVLAVEESIICQGDNHG